MTETDTFPIPPAEVLRRAIRRKQLKEIETRRQQEAARARQVHDFAEDFLVHHVTADDLESIRHRVAAAVQNDRFEALVYHFPSDLCSDSGRAINNRQDNWPETLQGKARELFDHYLDVAKPAGYRLKATIISFPDGMPGDVGLFLNWAPDRA